MTLFGFYRVMNFKGRLSLDTITKPGVNLDNFMPGWNSFVDNFVEKLSAQRHPLGSPTLFPLLKSSPTALRPSESKDKNPRINSGPFSMVLGARIWKNSPI